VHATNWKHPAAVSAAYSL